MGSSGPGVGESVYGIGIYYTSDPTVAEKYAKIVQPVKITSPNGSVEINKRDAMVRSFIVPALRKIGLSPDYAPAIVEYIAGQNSQLPKNVDIEIGKSEIIQKNLDTSTIVAQTKKAQFDQYDLKNIDHINQLKSKGITGTSYIDNHIINYVIFP